MEVVCIIAVQVNMRCMRREAQAITKEAAQFLGSVPRRGMPNDAEGTHSMHSAWHAFPREPFIHSSSGTDSIDTSLALPLAVF